MRALLDINVIIALLDSNHAFHQRAYEWWIDNCQFGWASCPLIENGVIRIMSNPNYSRLEKYTPADLISIFQEFVEDTDHEFWPDDISFCDGKSFLSDRLHSSRALTDLYLLGLAVKHGGRLATFDQGIPLSAVKNARVENLLVT